MSQSSVARIEHTPESARVDVLARLLAAAGFQLAVLDHEGRPIAPQSEYRASLKNKGGRRFAAHLDVRPSTEGWWGHVFWSACERAAPELTFSSSRFRRDLRRWADTDSVQPSIEEIRAPAERLEPPAKIAPVTPTRMHGPTATT